MNSSQLFCVFVNRHRNKYFGGSDVPSEWSEVPGSCSMGTGWWLAKGSAKGEHERRRESELRNIHPASQPASQRSRRTEEEYWLVDRCVVFGVWETIVMEFLMLNGWRVIILSNFFHHTNIISFTCLIGLGLTLPSPLESLCWSSFGFKRNDCINCTCIPF